MECFLHAKCSWHYINFIRRRSSVMCFTLRDHSKVKPPKLQKTSCPSKSNPKTFTRRQYIYGNSTFILTLLDYAVAKSCPARAITTLCSYDVIRLLKEMVCGKILFLPIHASLTKKYKTPGYRRDTLHPPTLLKNAF